MQQQQPHSTVHNRYLGRKIRMSWSLGNVPPYVMWNAQVKRMEGVAADILFGIFEELGVEFKFEPADRSVNLNGRPTLGQGAEFMLNQSQAALLLSGDSLAP